MILIFLSQFMFLSDFWTTEFYKNNSHTHHSTIWDLESFTKNLMQLCCSQSSGILETTTNLKMIISNQGSLEVSAFLIKWKLSNLLIFQILSFQKLLRTDLDSFEKWFSEFRVVKRGFSSVGRVFGIEKMSKHWYYYLIRPAAGAEK